MTKALIGSFLAAGAFVASSAHAGDLVKVDKPDGTEVGRYATFAAGCTAASDGDTVTFLADCYFGKDSGSQQTVGKRLTVDFGGHTVSNSSHNLFSVSKDGVVFRNGTFGSYGQSAIIFSGDCTAYVTNCTLVGTCGAWSANYKSVVRYGSGTVFAGATALSDNGKISVRLESDDIIFASSSLISGNAVSYDRLIITGGKFKPNPASYLVGKVRAVAEQTSTDHGTCNYTVKPLADGDVAATIVRTTGWTNWFDSVSSAFSSARAGDRLKMERDYVVGGSGYFSTSYAIDVDLNGHAISNAVSANLIRNSADGIVFRNGTVATGGQCCFQGDGGAIYVTNCTLTTSRPGADTCSCYGGATSTLFCGEGTKILNSSFKSGNGAMRVIADGVESTSSKWLDSGSNNQIELRRGAFASKPYVKIVAVGSVYGEQQTVREYGTMDYVVFPEDEPGDFPIGDCVAVADVRMCTTWSDAYASVSDGGVVRLLKDIDFGSSGATIDKNMTLDLSGHIFGNSGKNFIETRKTLTLRGGGTVQATGSSTVCFTGVGRVDVWDCTLAGNCVIWGSTTQVYLHALDSIVTTASLVSQNSDAKTGLTVSNGVIRCDKLWDGSVGSKGTLITVAGGSWKVNPWTYASAARMNFVEGLIVRQVPTDGYYDVIPCPETLDVDLDDASFVAPVYTGSLASAREIVVNVTSADSWKGRRTLLADFSALAGSANLTFTVGTVPAACQRDFTLRYVDGKLYANLKRGGVLILR